MASDDSDAVRWENLGYFDGNIMESDPWIPSWSHDLPLGASNQLEIFTMPLQLSSTLQNSSKSSSCERAAAQTAQHIDGPHQTSLDSYKLSGVAQKLVIPPNTCY